MIKNIKAYAYIFFLFLESRWSYLKSQSIFIDRLRGERPQVRHYGLVRVALRRTEGSTLLVTPVRPNPTEYVQVNYEF